jgi:ATP-dependent Clp protease ATP-binding subunit ClpC
MGARPIKRAIQSEIEDKLSEEILKKSIIPGDTVTAKRVKDETVFEKKQKKERS